MDERDFRGIGRSAQEELRRRALVLILQQGQSQTEAALVVGVQRQTVNIWLQRYRGNAVTVYEINPLAPDPLQIDLSSNPYKHGERTRRTK